MAVHLGRQLEHDAEPAGWPELTQLGEDGWTVAVVAGFAGGVLVVARRNGHEVRRSGQSVSEIAHDVVEEARRFQRAA